MSQAIRRPRTWIFGLLFLCLAAAAAFFAFRPAPAAVRPLCGPTYIWDCTLRNGSHTTVSGTVCEIEKYEQKKHAVCVRG